jgi:hypothetical protein
MESPHFQDGKKVKDKVRLSDYDMVVIFKHMVVSKRFISAAMECIGDGVHVYARLVL